MDGLSILGRMERYRLKGAVAAGATDITDAAVVATKNREIFEFNVGFGTIVSGAATSLEVHGSIDGGSTYAILKDQSGNNVSLTIPDTAGSKIAVIQVVRPTGKVTHLKLVIKRATQNSTVELAWCNVGNPRTMSVTQPTGSVSTSKNFVGCEP